MHANFEMKFPIKKKNTHKNAAENRQVLAELVCTYKFYG